MLALVSYAEVCDDGARLRYHRRMTWFEDLSPYRYSSESIRGAAPVLHVGWLEAGRSFPQGPVPSALLQRLWLLEEHAQVQITRGMHYCDLGPPCRGSDECAWGHGEIWAVGADGTRFAAPSLVAHYVAAHAYQPPQVFVAAVLRVASLSLEEATAKDLCLTCGSHLAETGRGNAWRGSDMKPGIDRSFVCDTCGCDYSRWFPLTGAGE
jgi:hypothetical protein